MNRPSAVITLASLRDRNGERSAAPPADRAPAAADSQALIVVCFVFLAFALLGFLTAPEMIVF